MSGLAKADCSVQHDAADEQTGVRGEEMRVLNIGSLNTDKTYKVKHFVQPKETLKALHYAEFCGGKGLNQSVALAKASAQVWHAGAVGQDGEELLKVLKEAGVHTELIQKVDGPSGHAIIQVDQTGQNCILICGGANDDISKEQIDAALNGFGAGDLLLLQNEISNIAYAMERAKEAGMQIAFNPSPINAAIREYPLALVDYFLVNEIEGKMLAGIDSEDPLLIKDALLTRYPQAAFVLTLGEAGAYFFNGQKTVFQPVYTVNAIDTTAAGDTFCGYFIAGLCEGLPVEARLKYASAASAIAVSRMGASPSIPDQAEVAAFLKK